jgi:hypothetical protein
VGEEEGKGGRHFPGRRDSVDRDPEGRSTNSKVEAHLPTVLREGGGRWLDQRLAEPEPMCSVREAHEATRV